SRSGTREPEQPSAASWPQQPSRSGTREPQQPSAASWAQQPSRMTGFGAASSAYTKMHSRRRSHRVSLHSLLTRALHRKTDGRGVSVVVGLHGGLRRIGVRDVLGNWAFHPSCRINSSNSHGNHHRLFPMAVRLLLDQQGYRIRVAVVALIPRDFLRRRRALLSGPIPQEGILMHSHAMGPTARRATLAWLI